MPRILILADDLSGAADTAIACVSAGTVAVVTLGEPEDEITEDVLAIDCDTRHLKAEEAAQRVAQILRRYSNDPEFILFKKLDSTFRGNIGAELAAVLKEIRRCNPTGQRVVAVMAPAFPARGRTTVNGEVLLHGVPVRKSDVWQGKESGSLHIPLLLSEAGLQATVLDLTLVHSGDDVLRQTMLSLAGTADVLVCDAETDDDLHAIARASVGLGSKTVWTGSAGLAYHLPRTDGNFGKALEKRVQRITPGPTLFAIGSRSKDSQEQIRALRAADLIDTHLIPPSVLLSGESSREWTQCIQEIQASLRSGMDTLVAIDAKEQYDPVEGRRISGALGTMLFAMGETVGALVASGGETARAILDAWVVRRLDMIGEVEAGLPFAVAAIRDRKIAVLTKAGAFGDSQTLLRCREFISSLGIGK